MSNQSLSNSSGDESASGAAPFRIATVNVNGVRAAFRKGMGDWLSSVNADVVALQEVRASTEDLAGLVAEQGWHILHEAAEAKGRAGVAILSRSEAVSHRLRLGEAITDSSGRWLEADFLHNGKLITVVSTYVHSGEVDTPRQESKYHFLEAMLLRFAELKAEKEFAVVVGDLNVGHRELDIKNWRGNVKRSGFLPKERAYFYRFFGEEGVETEGPDGTIGTGLGWVDIGRKFAGEVDGPYTWWSNRGQAFDNDTGWRIDYQVATPALAEKLSHYRVDRAKSYDTRWSDHAPVVADYQF